MAAFRNPGAREAAWGRWFAKRGLTASDVLAGESAPEPSERLKAWQAKHERLPLEQRLGQRTVRMEFRAARPVHNPDDYLELRA